MEVGYTLYVYIEKSDKLFSSHHTYGCVSGVLRSEPTENREGHPTFGVRFRTQEGGAGSPPTKGEGEDKGKNIAKIVILIKNLVYICSIICIVLCLISL